MAIDGSPTESVNTVYINIFVYRYFHGDILAGFKFVVVNIYAVLDIGNLYFCRLLFFADPYQSVKIKPLQKFQRIQKLVLNCA